MWTLSTQLPRQTGTDFHSCQYSQPTLSAIICIMWMPNQRKKRWLKTYSETLTWFLCCFGGKAFQYTQMLKIFAFLLFYRNSFLKMQGKMVKQKFSLQVCLIWVKRWPCQSIRANWASQIANGEKRTKWKGSCFVKGDVLPQHHALHRWPESLRRRLSPVSTALLTQAQGPSLIPGTYVEKPSVVSRVCNLRTGGRQVNI